MRKLGKKFAVSNSERSSVVASWSSQRGASAIRPIKKPTSMQVSAEMKALDELLANHPVNVNVMGDYLKTHSIQPRQYAIMFAVASKAFPNRPSNATYIVDAVKMAANVTHEQANAFAQFMMWKWGKL
ncbi:Uncharacterised protein [uncultured archaeon]|nr:Uncharacterised protein [uncultured archaeon]